MEGWKIEEDRQILDPSSSFSLTTAFVVFVVVVWCYVMLFVLVVCLLYQNLSNSKTFCKGFAHCSLELSVWGCVCVWLSEWKSVWNGWLLTSPTSLFLTLTPCCTFPNRKGYAGAIFYSLFRESEPWERCISGLFSFHVFFGVSLHSSLSCKTTHFFKKRSRKKEMSPSFKRVNELKLFLFFCGGFIGRA